MFSVDKYFPAQLPILLIFLIRIYIYLVTVVRSFFGCLKFCFINKGSLEFGVLVLVSSQCFPLFFVSKEESHLKSLTNLTRFCYCNLGCFDSFIIQTGLAD